MLHKRLQRTVILTVYAIFINRLADLRYRLWTPASYPLKAVPLNRDECSLMPASPPAVALMRP
jgi:hypothetical protein